MKLRRDTVTRQLAVNPYDIEALEGWLEELARREGLRLKSCGADYFTFRRGEPVPLRYRTAPARMVGFDPGPSRELVELYRDAGWAFADTYRYDFHIFVSQDPRAVEPYTDTDTLAWSLKRLSWRLWLTGLARLAFWAGTLALLFWLCLNTPLSSYSAWIPLYAFYLVDAVTTLFDLRALMRLRRQLQDGVPLEQRRPDGARHITSARVRAVLRRTLALAGLLLLLYLLLTEKARL